MKTVHSHLLRNLGAAALLLTFAGSSSGCAGDNAGRAAAPASSVPVRESSAAGPPASSVRSPVRRTQVGVNKIAWYERGRGPALVLLTGTGSTLGEWDPALLALLAKQHRLILMDYPGIGLSSRLRTRTVSFARMADETAAFMRAIHVPRADVLGWSMGGFVAQQLAERHPGQVRRLVLAGTNPGGKHTKLGPTDAQAVDSDPNASDAAVLKELYPATSVGQREGRAFLRRLDRASSTGVIPDDFTVPTRTYNAQVQAEDPWLRSNRNYEQLAGLPMPVLATGGRQDLVVPFVNLQRIAAQAPQGQAVKFAGSHGFLFSDRTRFTAVVDDFLK